MVKYIVFKAVGGLIDVTWLFHFESDLKRIISSYVLILSLLVGAFVVYVYVCTRREGMGTQGNCSPKWCIVYILIMTCTSNMIKYVRVEGNVCFILYNYSYHCPINSSYLPRKG